MGNVRATFLKPLESVFTLPATKDVKGFIEAYENSLKTFTDHTLSMAAQRIINTRETRTFPLPAECTKACRDAIAAMKAERETGKDSNRFEIRNAPLEVREPTCNPNRRKQTDEMFAVFPSAREAVSEGWAWTLWNWINENQREPDQYEMKNIRAKGLERSDDIKEMLGINKELNPEYKGNPFQRKLLSFWNSAQGRLSNLVNGV